jgi:hypothetical protein
MILYHGSNSNIELIDLNKCKPYKDFGKGFYLTSIEDQALKMAERVVRIYGGKPCVNIYEFDEDLLLNNELSIKIFNKPTKEWALFVINNRDKNYNAIECKESNHDFKFDIVIGPIANDDLALLFRQFSKELISLDALVKAMKYKELTNQYSFHTEKVLVHLRKVGVRHE